LPKQTRAQAASMVDRIAQALAKADGEVVDADPGRYRRLAIASLRPLMIPTKSMIDAAHKAVCFDAAWTINSRCDFQKAVKAMIE
jgi:hypothetical protein